MIRLEKILGGIVSEVVNDLYGTRPDEKLVQIQKTRKDQDGDFTIVVFPLVKISHKDPVTTGQEIGASLIDKVSDIESFEVLKGFLNLVLKPTYWLAFLNEAMGGGKYGEKAITKESPIVMVEYSSPNTNKPLHLGHVRNNLLGFSVSQILKANGKQVKMVNLVNDRGIHICKSMLAWQKWGQGQTPESTGVKGDQLVGNYYVLFDKALKEEVELKKGQGMTEEDAAQNSSLLAEAQEMLRKWEAGDEEVNELWSTMNSWVYEGFDKTYQNLGIYFDKIYYESQTYKHGKSLVLRGLEDGVLYKKDDGSVWADLSDEGLDQKLLLRSDGTSVYMTQDLGTAEQRYSESGFDSHVYVVGNEQDYHFKVLNLILSKLGFEWANRLYHLSYGMVELPEGKMKSREGKVVDADDLVNEMIQTAKDVSADLGKLEDFSMEERDEINTRIAMGALKYFILKVDPVKTMLFNPAESIDFNGNTGPFIQYTYVRTKSVLRKAGELGYTIPDQVNDKLELSSKEIELLKTVYTYPELLEEAGSQLSPALVANYLYELVKDFNHFYQHHPIVKEEDSDKREFRMALSGFIARHIHDAMLLLGIVMPERM